MYYNVLTFKCKKKIIYRILKDKKISYYICCIILKKGKRLFCWQAY